jgi:DNA-binding beta-propeller fold protein YncE
MRAVNFGQKDVFPIVARIISAQHEERGRYITHGELTEALTIDQETRRLLDGLTSMRRRPVMSNTDHPTSHQEDHMKRDIARLSWTLAVIVALGAVALVSPSQAQIAVSANDNKVVNDNGTVKVVPNAPPDTVAVIDLKASPPRVVAEVEAPVSVTGPPLSVALTPDEGLALVTASNKVDPADPTKQTPDNRVSVIDLKASPPKVIATLEAGKGAAGISINRQGTLALVSNIADGTVSVFAIQGKTVTPAGTVEVGGAKAGGGMVGIAPDGKTALVSRSLDNRVSVLSIEGTKVEYTKRDMTAGVRPIVLDIAANGAFAIVGSLAGAASGDNDSISLIDLTTKPPRVVDTIGVLGPTAEGLKISPDSSVVAVVVHNGSNRAKDSPFYNPAAREGERRPRRHPVGGEVTAGESRGRLRAASPGTRWTRRRCPRGRPTRRPGTGDCRAW